MRGLNCSSLSKEEKVIPSSYKTLDNDKKALGISNKMIVLLLVMIFWNFSN